MLLRSWFNVVSVILFSDGAMMWYEDSYRNGFNDRIRQIISHPRDWDINWGPGDSVPEYNYEFQADQAAVSLQPRLVVLPDSKEETRGVWHSQQRGSAIIPYFGAEVRVTPNRDKPKKFYRGTVTSKIRSNFSYQRKRNQRKYNRGLPLVEYSMDEPVFAKVCARCPSDRAVLAQRGANSVLMEVPPIIPCHPRSSVDKVRQEIVAGPQPGDEVPEGSHQILIRLVHRRRTLATCVTRYNVIVRKCPELEVSPGIRIDCPRGRAWGAVCNISCDKGYDLEGESYAECSDDLEWSRVNPHCVPTTQCPVPVSPDHGQLSCRTPLHQPVRTPGLLPDGSVCQFLCDPGYTIPPAQQHLSKVRCMAGTWNSDQDPVCVETNDLKEEVTVSEVSAADVLRFDGRGCPDNYCKNKGRCIMILNKPMCSCMSGYFGPTCDDVDTEDLSNWITL